MSRKVLILFAHPAYHRSRANRAMAEAVRDLDGVTFHDLYEAYPDLLIDVAREQDLLLGHDAVIAQHPFYWYSAPAILKEWQDLVLTHGWAYGRAGRALEGKLWMHALTAGGPQESYGEMGYNRFTVGDLTRPFEATANLCRMRWRDPFIVHASHLNSNQALADAARRYRAQVLGLMREKS
ncbi:MAG TPA: NAD(P)H-dependent oxidoreductase [Caulobacterales bacterium]|nr:NAD(P)H-dependent oxidoreductase [Caulobacterales bacterium]